MRSNFCALLALLPSLSAAPLFMTAVIVLCGLAASSPAAIVHYGNDVEFPDSSDHLPDYLLGSKYTVTQPIVLQKAGIIFNGSTITNAQVGIYTDAGGAPHTLVAETGSFEVYFDAYRETPLLTTPTIPAGDYWFMAVFDAASTTGVGVSFDDGAQAAYIYHKFNLPLPATFPAPSIYTGRAFNYYLVGETTTSSDYNQDGGVDGADFLTWQRHVGGPGNLGQGDADGDSNVTAADLAVWKQQFVSAALAPSAAVPEPASLALLPLAIPALLCCCRCCHRRRANRG